MPNIKSAKKRVLIAEVRNARNKANKSALKTAIKKFEAAAVEGNRTEAEGAYKVAVKSIDKAAAKGLMHKNNAAHKKSALTLKLNQRTTKTAARHWNNCLSCVAVRFIARLCLAKWTERFSRNWALDLHVSPCKRSRFNRYLDLYTTTSGL